LIKHQREMKTPMQEHIEWLKKEKDEHGYEKHPYFECAIEHAESMLEKEKEVMCQFQSDGQWRDFYVKYEDNEDCFDKTFNTKER